MKIFNKLECYLTNDSGNHRFLIEGYGIPGVGKSFVCNNFYKLYKEKFGGVYYHSIDDYHQNRVVRILHKILLILRGLLFTPSIITANFKLINDFENIKGLVKLRLLFNLLLISSVIHRHWSRQNLLVLDQGIFQAIWSCYFYNQCESSEVLSSRLVDLIDELLDKMCITKVVILNISSEKATIVSRLTQREIKGSSPMNSLEKSIVERGSSTTIHMGHFLIKAAEQSDRYKVFDIKN